jgi:hypothetical protein
MIAKAGTPAYVTSKVLGHRSVHFKRIAPDERSSEAHARYRLPPTGGGRHRVRLSEGGVLFERTGSRGERQHVRSRLLVEAEELAQPS